VAVTDAQVRRLMKELTKDGRIGHAAMKSGMDRKTARKYARAGALPSETAKKERTWRTRPNPFEQDWPSVEAQLVDAPELEAKSIFEYLMDTYPGRYDAGQLRTFQRHVRRWRAMHGPDKEVFFAQQHRPGEALQTDFTWDTELQVTIGGEPLSSLLCHVVLPYSNWEWVTVCRSESIPALRRGVQAAVLQLGHVPEFHQTDNSTSATHRLATGKRDFNEDYLALMRHYGMTPRTTAVGAKEQNGNVEALNGALKRRLKQRLLLRGHRDFASVADYEQWLQDVLRQSNKVLRAKRLDEELAVMRPITVKPLPEYTEERVRVTAWSTIRVKRNTYSVPSRLIGEQVRVRIFDDRLEVFFGGALQETIERLHGAQGHRINYRHLIWSLVQKPAAFARYRYRQDLFPTLVFRRAYDALCGADVSRKADLAYLRILFVAATTLESDVEVALELLLDQGQVPTVEDVKALVSHEEEIAVPSVVAPTVDLASYDQLFGASWAQEVGR